MEFGLFYCGHHGEYNIAGLIEISKIFVMQDKIFERASPCDRVQQSFLLDLILFIVDVSVHQTSL